MSRHKFAGMNPVRQRQIGVNPSRGGFFSLPSGERNFGQQASLPYDQQLNMNHKSNFSHCGAHGGPHSNMNHMSNFAHNNFAHNNFAHNNFVHSNFAHNNFAHNNFAHSNFISGGNTDAVFSGGMSNVGPQDRIFAGNYATGRRGVAQGGAQRGLLPGQTPAERDLNCNKMCIRGELGPGTPYWFVNGKDCKCKDRSGGGAPGPRIMSEQDANFFRKNFQPTGTGQYEMRKR